MCRGGDAEADGDAARPADAPAPHRTGSPSVDTYISSRAHFEASLLAREGSSGEQLLRETSRLVLVVHPDPETRRYLSQWVSAVLSSRPSLELRLETVPAASEATQLLLLDVRLLVSDSEVLLKQGATLPEFVDSHASLRQIPMLVIDEGEHYARALERSTHTDAAPRRIVRKPLGRNALVAALRELLPAP